MDESNLSNSPILTIQDLPNELLIQILKWIVDESGLDNVQQVCTRWYSVIDELVGRKVCNFSRRVVHPSNPDVSKQGLDLIQEIGVSSLRITAYNCDLLQKPPCPLSSFKYAYLVKRLDFQGSLHPDLFRSLTKDLINLKEFVVSMPVLAHLRIEDLKCLIFPSLTRLEVNRSCGYDDEEEPAMPRLIFLFQVGNFHRLTHLLVQLPLLGPSQDLKMVHVFSRFVSRHPALRVVHVVMSFPSLEQLETLGRGWERRPCRPEDVESIISEIRRHRYGRFLEDLKIRCNHSFLRYPTLDIWREFMGRQCHLQKLHLGIGLIPSEDLKESLSSSGSTLEELTLSKGYYSTSGETNDTDELTDCAALSSLISLKIFRLIRGQKVIGAIYLPPSLVRIEIGGFMKPEEAAYILLCFPNLQEVCLHLSQSGEEGLYGVRLDTLKQFVKNRKVRVLELGGNFMRDGFPQEGIPNYDPVNFRRLTLNNQQELHWELNGMGYYNVVKKEKDQIQ